MRLVEIPYYCVPREEDERANSEFKRLFTNVQRWWPQPREEGEPGLGRLRALAHGERLPAEHVQQAIDYCLAAIEWYKTAPEPFPGNNNHATADFVAILSVLQVES